MKRIVLLVFCWGAIGVLSGSLAVAADVTMRGRLEKVDGKSLRVVDQQGHVKNVRVNDQTVIVSAETKARYEVAWLRAGSKVNFVERNGHLMVLVVEEVPK